MIVTAQQNDTVDLICWRYLGATAGVTEAVLKSNPQINSKDPILALGTQLTLPDKHAPVKKTINLWD